MNRITLDTGGNTRRANFIGPFPLPSTGKTMDPAASSSAEQHPQERVRILVVDDNEDGTLTMSLILRKQGHVVEVANDGAEALAVGRRFHPDLVIMDIGMPIMNGYGACELMREEPWGRRARIVALSGWGQEHDRQRSFSVGFDEHVVKPIDMNTLWRLVNTPITPMDGA